MSACLAEHESSILSEVAKLVVESTLSECKKARLIAHLWKLGALVRIQSFRQCAFIFDRKIMKNDMWEAVNGNVVSVKKRVSNSKEFRLGKQYEVTDTVAFNVGNSMAKHIVELHNAWVQEQLKLQENKVPQDTVYCEMTNQFYSSVSGVRKSDSFFDTWVDMKDMFPRKEDQ